MATRRPNLSKWLVSNYPEIHGFYIEEVRTGVKHKPISIFIRKQWVRSYRGFGEPYFFDIRAITIFKSIDMNMLRLIVLEEELKLRRNNILKGFNLEKSAGEKIIVSDTEALRLRADLVKIEIRAGRAIIKSEFRN